jgi:hypothetical protein
VFRVLARASILMAVAPSVPVAWWPGARALPDSVIRRLPRPVAPDRITTLYPSGSRVIAIPVDGGRPVPSRRAAPPVGPVLAAAPWGEPLLPFAGVTVSTCQVPRQWLRSESLAAQVIAMPRARPKSAPPTPAPPTSASPMPRHATIIQLPRQPRQWPPAIDQRRPHGRFRRAAALALGLLLSLVAVEAAARSTRR